MAKKTLLQMVQKILSDMDSDEVNSISDTVEAMQVAEIVRFSYEELIATLKIPERMSLIPLESLADVNRPNYLKIPDSVKGFQWIRYNGKTVQYLNPESFIDLVLDRSEGTLVEDFQNVSYYVKNDEDPQYWTSFDDEYVVFDAFNQDVESTLQESKSIAYAEMGSNFELSDDYVPDLDDNLFPLLINEAKAVCFVDLKQVSNSKAEQNARRQLVRVQNELNRTAKPSPRSRLPDYGRRR